jgi:hypothetical protein
LSGTGWTCDRVDTLLTCNLASLAAGDSSDIIITLNAPSTPTLFQNSASVSSDTVDLVPGNNDTVLDIRVRYFMTFIPMLFCP